jgi:tetratricopeptide (TPR) repeat protein
MRSSTLVFYIALFLLPAPALAQADADALYRERATPGQAEAAAALWQAQLTANPGDIDAAWKLARAQYWVGTHGPDAGRRAALERGLAVARQLAMRTPGRPEGHFWLAANMGALAESFGLRQGLRYRGDIKRELETVLKIDPGFQQGSPDRALGRWYHKVPGLFGGSREQAEAHLRKSLTYNANSTVSRFFLAELLFDMDRDAEAIEELKKVVAAPPDPEWEPEDRVYKERARRRLN